VLLRALRKALVRSRDWSLEHRFEPQLHLGPSVSEVAPEIGPKR